MKNLAVIIGRFAPVHKGHIDHLFARATEYDAVLVIFGSAWQPPNTRNPFDPAFREKLLRTALVENFGPDEEKKYSFAAVKDYLYSHDRWLLQVQTKVEEWQETLRASNSDFEKTSVTLIAAEKDHTSSYVHHFPQWNKRLLDFDKSQAHNATDIRNAIFSKEYESIANIVTPGVLDLLKTWREGEVAQEVVAETQWNQGYRMKLCRVQGNEVKIMPYEPTYMTADAVVTWRGNVLMIKRKSRPGKGLLALPGGFLEPYETLFEAALREAAEETGIQIFQPGSSKPQPLSPQWCTGSDTFDHPLRSQRGRIITQAFRFAIPDEMFVRTQHGSDAAGTIWLPIAVALADTTALSIFEDHQAIIAHLVLHK